MNLLNDCSEEATEDKPEGQARKCTSSNLSALRNCTVLAMSNLLNANIDSGLMHSIGVSPFSSVTSIVDTKVRQRLKPRKTVLN